MIGVDVGVTLHAFGSQKLEAPSLSAEVGDRFLPVLVAGNVVVEVRLHVLNGKGLLHGCDIQISYKVGQLLDDG